METLLIYHSRANYDSPVSQFIGCLGILIITGVLLTMWFDTFKDTRPKK